MTQTITSTTGTVKGIQEVKDFVNMCNSKFAKVHKVVSEIKIPGYLQYTLLTNNEIRIYI